MINDKWKIYWGEYVSNAYTYGSKINFRDDKSVEFENRLMPPGTVIKRWFSKTNFQFNKIEPSLPLIDGESAYKITVNMDYDQEDESEIMLRIVFFDRYDDEAESIILRGKTNYFKPSIKTYNYNIELVNGGISKFKFNSLILTEVSQEEFNEDQERIEAIKENSKKDKKLRKKHKKTQRQRTI